MAEREGDTVRRPIGYFLAKDGRSIPAYHASVTPKVVYDPHMNSFKVSHSNVITVDMSENAPNPPPPKL